jgi:hypothetical protein
MGQFPVFETDQPNGQQPTHIAPPASQPVPAGPQAAPPVQQQYLRRPPYTAAAVQDHRPDIAAHAPESERSGPKKLWELAYDLLRSAEPGELIHWEVFGQAMGKDGTVHGQRHLVQSAVRRAIQELERNDKMTARNVRAFGYKVVPTEERLELARSHQDRAVKEIRLARRQVTNVNLAAMEPNTRRAFELTAMALGQQAAILERTNIRQEALESRVDEVLTEQRLKAEEMTAVQQRLAALEARLGNAPPPVQAPPGLHPAGAYQQPPWQQNSGYPTQGRTG